MSSYVSVIGDPHGCYLTFKSLMDKLPQENNRIIIIGDILDRGPRSFELLEHVQEEGLEMILGNHEYMFLYRNQSDELMDLWMQNGGDTTMQSVEAKATTDQAKADALSSMEKFIKGLKLSVTIDVSNNTEQPKHLLISHAGISQYFYELMDQNIEACFQVDLWDDHSCLWNRDKLEVIENHIQIVGHMPMNEGPKNVQGNYYIDTGCVYSEYPGCGTLTAAVFEIGKEPIPKFIQEKNIDV